MRNRHGNHLFSQNNNKFNNSDKIKLKYDAQLTYSF